MFRDIEFYFVGSFYLAVHKVVINACNGVVQAR